MRRTDKATKARKAARMGYWDRVFALIDALPKPHIARTRVVTDPHTGHSTLERLPVRFTVQ